MIKIAAIFLLGSLLGPYSFSSIKRLLSRTLQVEHVELPQNVSYINLGDCPVCTETQEINDTSQVVLLPCGHLFHENCIEGVRTHANTNDEVPACPTCRALFTQTQYVYLSTQPNTIQQRGNQGAENNTPNSDSIDTPQEQQNHYFIGQTLIGLTSGLGGVYLAQKFWPNSR